MKPVLAYSRDSGTRPDSAAGRSPRHPQTATPDPEPRHHEWLGVTLSELAVWVGVLALVAAYLVVGGL